MGTVAVRKRRGKQGDADGKQSNVTDTARVWHGNHRPREGAVYKAWPEASRSWIRRRSTSHVDGSGPRCGSSP